MAITKFVTVAEAMKQAPIAAGFTSKLDDIVGPWIEAVSQQVRTFCRRKFDLNDHKTYVMSPDSFGQQEPYRVRLPEWPVTPDTLFVNYDPEGRFIDGVSLPALLTENVDYTVDNDTGWIEFFSNNLTYNPRGIKLEWNGGYPVDGDGIVAVPESIKRACITQLVFMLNRLQASQAGQSQEKGNRGGNQHTFTLDAQTGLIGEAQVLLYDFRVPLMGRT